MSRQLTLLFSIVAYAIFFATFLYLIAFVGDLACARRTVDVGRIAAGAAAMIIDVALIALFGLQHSVMARPGSSKAGHGSCRRRPSAASMCFSQAPR